MKHKFSIAALALVSLCSLSSCLIYQGVRLVVREDYPGSRPPMVIKDNNGKPASQNWQKTTAYMLPPEGINEAVTYAEDGVPYGVNTKYSNIVKSPHAPHHALDYTGSKAGDKVWDPYTRKAFYIKRTYTLN